MDETLAVSDRPTLESVDRERMVQALSELCAVVDREADSGEEQLASGLRTGLARLAGPLAGEPAATQAAVQSALAGAESVARRDIQLGRGERLARLLPSFAYLVVLPVAGQAEALRISQQAERLLAGEGA